MRLLALFLAVVGARFWLVNRYTLAMPYWDQWDAEGLGVIKPFLNGTLSLHALLLPHNEHRIFLTRLVTLALLAVNGQWDNQVEMAANAVFCGLSAVGIAGAASGAFRGGFQRAIPLAVGVYFLLPYGWENTLCGFQSQNYFLNFFSLLAVWGLAIHRAGTKAWWAGLAGAVLAFLSMASGFLAAAAVLASLSLSWARKRRRPLRREWITAAFCLGLVAVGWTTRTEVPGHAHLKAESLSAWWLASARFLAWPSVDHPAFGALALVPPLLLAVVHFRRSPNAEGGARRDALLLAASLWTLLQTAAMAYGRGGHGALPAGRYTDALGLVHLVNFFVWLALFRQGASARWRGLTACGAILYTGLLLTGLQAETRRNFREDMPDFQRQLRVEEQNARGYVVTHDFVRFLADKPLLSLPYPSPARLASALDDPALRRVLPADLRAPLHWQEGTAEADTPTFAPAGYDPACGEPATGASWGSYPASASVGKVTFRANLTAPATLPYLRFVFAGSVGEPGLSFALRDTESGLQTVWRPHATSRPSWRQDDLPSPGRNLQVEAVDANPARWFAFGEPVEVGAWSRWTGFLLRRGGWFLLTGVSLAGGLELLALLARRSTSTRPPEKESTRGPAGSGEAAPLNLLSVVIPARDEERCLAGTVETLHAELRRAGVPHEIIVVDDGSTDGTGPLLRTLHDRIPEVRPIENTGRHGFGRAIICGLDQMQGDAAVVMMADASDDPADVVRYWHVLQAGYDCAFGSRFVRGSRVEGYPWFKLTVNRLANLFIKGLFRVPCNDVTNAFKAYRREAIDGCRPLIAPHFNLTVELPLKAMVRGYRWKVVPITWRNRREGATKFKLKEMGSRYLFVCLYVWLEKHLSRGDYRRG